MDREPRLCLLMHALTRLMTEKRVRSDTDPLCSSKETIMKHLAIIVRDDAYDKLLTPLTFAYLNATREVTVDVLFVLWAVRALTEDGARTLQVEGRHAAEMEALKTRMRADGEPTEILEWLKMLKGTGHVNFYACRIAAGTFGVNETNLVPEASGVVDSTWFLQEKAMKADHCRGLLMVRSASAHAR